MAGPLPQGMQRVVLGKGFVAAVLSEVAQLRAGRVFVLSNRSSAAKADELADALRGAGVLAEGSVCTDVVMGGAEEGLLRAADRAAAAKADCLVTLGGGAVQDAGKIIRMWLSTAPDEGGRASMSAIQTACKRDPLPPLPPQIALPNSFAMAEFTAVAGMTTAENVKSGIAHPAIMPTAVVFDPVLAAGLPEWVRFGTALRGVEHVVGALTHPAATEEVRTGALEGAALLAEGLEAMLAAPTCPAAMQRVFEGGWHAIVALNKGCYPALGHLVENQYSARYDVHQGSCSGVLMARIMAHHAPSTAPLQALLAAAFGRPGTPATQVVTELVRRLPGVQHDHTPEVAAGLQGFADFLFEKHIDRLNRLSPTPFHSAADIHGMLTRPVADFAASAL
eukprot:TRINITY_DN993_c0_g3_i1.p1 TRINITY_DN993_c0_g3~~TRINITY_DN993_c0_g3_i1.p1  ORF type:complete len:412 (+),score=115.08 TRINITY_DN993_c0_g3_i1:60-1238(+)